MKLLINEPPLQVLPSLAELIGLNEAIVLQQIHYWVVNAKNKGIMIDGEKFVLNTYEDWETNFPFWSNSTIKRIFASLENMNLIISKKPFANKHDQTKAYRPNYVQIEQLESVKMTQSGMSKRHDVNMNPKTIVETTTNILPDGMNFPPDWKFFHGEDLTENEMEEFKARQFNLDVKDAAWLICQGAEHLKPLAIAFMLTRRIILPTEKKKISGHRKALNEMYDAKPNGVRAEQVKQATEILMRSKDKGGRPFVVTNLFHIIETAKNIANLPPNMQPEDIQQLDPDEIKAFQEHLKGQVKK